VANGSATFFNLLKAGVSKPSMCLVGGWCTQKDNRSLSLFSLIIVHHFPIFFTYHDLAGGLEHVLFFHILGIIGSFFPLTNSYFSRWLLHHQPVIHDDPPRAQMPNHQISVTFVTHW